MTIKSSFSDPIRKVTVVDTLASRIRARILHNEIKAGEQLRQEALAEAYGVSRMPIREALRQLEAEGLVVFNPHRGVIVSDMSVEEVEELFDLRLLIEPDLIIRAARTASKADHEQARKALDACNAAYDSGDVVRWGETNAAFHQSLYRPAGRDRSMALVHSLNSNIDRYVRLQLSGDKFARDRAREEHEHMLSLYVAGDMDALGEYLQKHIAHAKDMLLSLLRDTPAASDGS